MPQSEVTAMIWERRAFNLHKQGLSLHEIQEVLGQDKRGQWYELDEIKYAIDLCADGPVPGYETEDDI